MGDDRCGGALGGALHCVAGERVGEAYAADGDPGGGKVQLPDAVEVDGEFLGVGGGDCAACTVADKAAGVAGTVATLLP